MSSIDLGNNDASVSCSSRCILDSLAVYLWLEAGRVGSSNLGMVVSPSEAKSGWVRWWILGLDITGIAITSLPDRGIFRNIYLT